MAAADQTAPGAGVALEPVSIPSSGAITLEGQLARGDSGVGRWAVVLLHGFPSGDVRGDKIGGDMPQLCERIANEMGFNALSFRFRGCGQSEGNFSLGGWCQDAAAAIDFMHAEVKPDALWVVGFGTGGSVGVVVSATSPRVAGAAVLGSPADFKDWAANPERLLRHGREVGVIKEPDYPADLEQWQAELKEIRADVMVEQFPPRPLLVVHGTEDEAVPHWDARLVADSHGSAELRIIGGGGHQLRHDPRAIAILLGWLVRQASNHQMISPNGDGPAGSG